MAALFRYISGVTFVFISITLLMVLLFTMGVFTVKVTAQAQQKTISRDFCYCLQDVISGLRGPVGSVFFEEAGQERVIVVEQIGIASVYSQNGDFLRRFMDIQDRVVVTGNVGESRGLLSLVLDPVYDENHKVYVYYIRNVDGKDWAYVSSFTTTNGVVDPNSERVMFRVYQPYVHGNGGPMLFGDDGYLYIATGDGGQKDDPEGKAQDKTTFHGKVLRIDVNGPQSFTSGESSIGKLYGVPESNPFSNTADALEEIYAYGIRNMWGCSVDSAEFGGTSRIFCAETGTDQSDEIDIIESGRNYGWNIKEGSHCKQPGNCSKLENEGVPIYEFPHIGQHALVGGYVYRGHAFPKLNLSSFYIYGDIMQGKIHALEEVSFNKPWVSEEWSPCKMNWCPSEARATPSPHVSAFGRDLNGELYVIMTDGLVANLPVGKMLKLVPPSISSGLKLTSSLWPILTALVALAWTTGHRL